MRVYLPVALVMAIVLGAAWWLCPPAPAYAVGDRIGGHLVHARRLTWNNSLQSHWEYKMRFAFEGQKPAYWWFRKPSCLKTDQGDTPLPASSARHTEAPSPQSQDQRTRH